MPARAHDRKATNSVRREKELMDRRALKRSCLEGERTIVDSSRRELTLDASHLYRRNRL